MPCASDTAEQKTRYLRLILPARHKDLFAISDRTYSLLLGLRVFGRVGKLQVVPESNNAHPVVVGYDFVNLDADEGILPHPLDLLSQRGEAV
jgi:hypothetical protein